MDSFHTVYVTVLVVSKRIQMFLRMLYIVSVHWLSYEDVLTWVVAVKQRFVAAPLASLVTDEISSAFVCVYSVHSSSRVTNAFWSLNTSESQLKIEACPSVRPLRPHRAVAVATDNVVAEHVDPRCFSNHSLLLFLFWPERSRKAAAAS